MVVKPELVKNKRYILVGAHKRRKQPKDISIHDESYVFSYINIYYVMSYVYRKIRILK